MDVTLSGTCRKESSIEGEDADWNSPCRSKHTIYLYISYILAFRGKAQVPVPRMSLADGQKYDE